MSLLVSYIPSWIPPVFAVMRIGRLWLPLPVVLVWPLMLLMWVLLGVVLLVMPKRPWLSGNPWLRLRAWWGLWCLPGTLRGLSISVQVKPDAAAEQQANQAEAEALASGAPAPLLPRQEPVEAGQKATAPPSSTKALQPPSVASALAVRRTTTTNAARARKAGKRPIRFTLRVI